MLANGDSSRASGSKDPSCLRYAPRSVIGSARLKSASCPWGYQSPCSANQTSVPNKQQARQMKKSIKDSAGRDWWMTHENRANSSLYFPSLKTRKMRVSRRTRSTTSAPPPDPSPCSCSSQKGRIAPKSMRLAMPKTCLIVVISLPSSRWPRRDWVFSNCSPMPCAMLLLMVFFSLASLVCWPVSRLSRKNSSNSWKRTLCTVRRRTKYSVVKTSTQAVSICWNTVIGRGAQLLTSKREHSSGEGRTWKTGSVEIIHTTIDTIIMKTKTREQIFDNTASPSLTSIVKKILSNTFRSTVKSPYIFDVCSHSTKPSFSTVSPRRISVCRCRCAWMDWMRSLIAVFFASLTTNTS
mmetsp:Transcript_34935/g.96526  ORF Transcript_34935/g.96526 Transcript_34935/m.96526 type:complete len:352 (-) Transcript_34935:342-1397(-)